jgi:ketosteroid isomerase-like protein
VIDGGDHVIVISHQEGVGRESRVPVEFLTASVYTVRGSKIVRAEVFDSREEALEAVGLTQ